MYVDDSRHPTLRRLGQSQCGVAHRDQLRALGVSRSYVAQQVTVHRWQAVGHNVVLMQNSAWTRSQLMWIAILDAGSQAALGSHTALELAGFRSFARESMEIHLIIARGARVTRLAGVRVHESRRLSRSALVGTAGLPRTDSARSAIDAGAWQRWPRFACAMLAAVVQQRICSAAQLERALGSVGRVRHKQYMRLAVSDIATGAQSMGELDVAGLCRRFGLVPPVRQVPRRGASGRLRYLDCEWRSAGGERVVLEIDGTHHLSVEHWQDDMRRERAIVLGGSRVLRATALEVRLEPAAIAADLIAAGVPQLTDLSDSQHALAC